MLRLIQFPVICKYTPSRAQQSRGIHILAVVGLGVVGCGNGHPAEQADQQPLTAGQCREHPDCDAAETCVRPGTVNLCDGAGCPPSQCNADFDCLGAGVDHICVNYSGVRVCEPPCSSTNPCGDHQDCGSDGHCEDKPCDADVDCPADFSCQSNLCARRFCDTDGPCSGYCVLGDCYPEAGTCETPQP